jgi:hypothetical protein
MAKQGSISVRARSTASRHDVFALLSDSSTWTRWTPFTAVELVEPASGGGGGVGSVKRTRYRGSTGWERIVALSPERQLSYSYFRGSLSPFIRDYVATVDLDDDGAGTTIHWHSTFTARFPGSGWLPRRILHPFLQRCADGLAAEAAAPARHARHED